tara:strand:- start:64 stop:1515 length:1452 start_codon:yes stop_codon:yes gene_type:complete
MTFGKDFNAEQRAAFDAMSAERGSGMNASLLNQDRSSGNVEGTDYYNAIRDEAIKPNNILNGYLGIQEIPNLMANGSSTRGSRGNNNLSSATLTDAEFEKGRNKFIDLMTPYSDTNMRNGFTYTADDDSGSFVESDIPSNMMSNGSNSGRGVDTSLSNTIGRDVASGMGDGLNNVMRMTENIQSKYGDPNDKTIDQIMAEFNADNAENAFQGMDNNRGLLQKTGDAFVPDFYQKGSGFTNNLNRAFGGADVTDSQIYNHLNVDKPYNNQTIVNNAISDATDGYHIRSGKDYGSMTKGNLPLGGLPATLGAMAYQQLDGIADSSLLDGVMGRGKANLSDVGGTFGYNAFLQSMDNIEGLRQSGNAPFLNKAHTLGQNMHGLLNRPPSEDAIRIAKQKDAGTFQPGKKAQAYKDKPVAVVKPRVKVDYNKNTPAPTQKKQSRAGAGAVKAPTRTTGSRGGRGNVAKKKSTPSKFSSGYSRRVGGR